MTMTPWGVALGLDSQNLYLVIWLNFVVKVCICHLPFECGKFGYGHGQNFDHVHNSELLAI